MKAQINDSGIERVKSARVVINAPSHQIFAVIDNPYRQFNKVVESKKDELIAWNNLSPSRWRYQLRVIEARSTEVISSYDRRIPFLLHWYANHEFKWAPKALVATLDRLKGVVEGNEPLDVKDRAWRK